MTIPSGVVILDGGCFKFLEDPALRASVTRDLEMVDMRIWPSAINILEIVQNRNRTVRNRLLKAARALAGDHLVLQWPFTMLAQIGHAIVDGKSSFTTASEGFERALVNPDQLTAKHIDVAERELAALETNFAKPYDDVRQPLQKLIVDRGAREAWSGSVDFLDRYWSTRKHEHVYVEAMWNRLELPGSPPINAVLTSHAWRIFHELNGFAAFARAIETKQKRKVEYTDLLQLVYAGLGDKGIVVSHDRGFLRAARTILVGRYKNVRVMSWQEFSEDC